MALFSVHRHLYIRAVRISFLFLLAQSSLASGEAGLLFRFHGDLVVLEPLYKTRLGDGSMWVLDGNIGNIIGRPGHLDGQNGERS